MSNTCILNVELRIENGTAIIPPGVTKIDHLKLDNDITNVEIPNSVVEIGDEAFWGCTGLTHIDIPDSVTKIGSYAFCDCTRLTSIEIPDSVTKIGLYAFSGCTSLASIKISDSVSEIGDLAFSWCKGLESIVVGNQNSIYKSENNSILSKDGQTFVCGCKSSIIPGSVTTIGNSAFSGCTGLTGIEIPDSVTTIENGAFSSCEGLELIAVGTQNKVYKSENNSILSKDGQTLVCGCKSSIIPGSVTTIGNSAFCGCTGLMGIEIPDSVTTIGKHAFAGCKGLTSIEIPDSVTTIGDEAFAGCPRLRSIEISDSVTTIGNEAFAICTDLTDVYVKAKRPESIRHFISSLDSTNRITLHVPVGTGNAYRHSELGSKFHEVIADVIVKNQTFIHYLFFDTETTGLPRNYQAPSSDVYNWPRMVQLSWISQDKNGKTISKGNYIIRPDGFTIPTQSSDIHGITTDRALLEGSSLRQVLDEFLEEARFAQILVGHNIGFDMKVLGCECVRIFGEDLIKDRSFIDTMEAATEFCAIPGYYGYKWPKLQELHYKLFGVEFEDAHDSSADIAATVKCYWEMKRRGLI